jgi:hypothetical protein
MNNKTRRVGHYVFMVCGILNIGFAVIDSNLSAALGWLSAICMGYAYESERLETQSQSKILSSGIVVDRDALSSILNYAPDRKDGSGAVPKD